MLKGFEKYCWEIQPDVRILKMRNGAKWQGQMDKLSFLRVYGHWNEERPNILSVFIRLFWSEPNQRQVCSMPGDWWGAMESSWLEGWNVSMCIVSSLWTIRMLSSAVFYVHRNKLKLFWKCYFVGLSVPRMITRVRPQVVLHMVAYIYAHVVVHIVA